MHEDSIGQLLNQVRALNETLDSERSLQPEELRELRLLRLTLMSVITVCARQLKKIAEAVKQLSTDLESDLALFTDKGELKSYGQSLEDLLKSIPDDSMFSNDSQDVKFLDENRNEIAPPELPWKKELTAKEALEPRLLLQNEVNKTHKWLACLLTRLKAWNGRETGRAACFFDLTGLIEIEQSLAVACLALAGARKEVASATQEIKDVREFLSRTIQSTDESESESLAPRTRERPPVSAAGEEAPAKKVLIVDDIAVNRKLLAKRLQKLNLECDFACNGQEAVDMALAGSYALVFMDCDMPVMDGFKATQTIRQAELSLGTHVPIIALTSYDREDDRERCLSSGMDEYLAKGASPNTLQEVVEWCLRRSQLKNEQDMSIDEYEEDIDLSSLSKTFTREELNEIFELFLPSTNTLMRCLRMSMDERDVRSTGHFAYSLKGPFASLGMLMTCKLAARLTDAAEENQWDEANDYYEMLRRNCDAMRTKLEERAARQG